MIREGRERLLVVPGICFTEFGQGIGLRCDSQLSIFDMGVDFRCIEMLVSEHFLHGFDVNAAGDDLSVSFRIRTLWGDSIDAVYR